MTKPVVIRSDDDFDAFIKQSGLRVVHFSAQWHPTCAELTQLLEDLLVELGSTFAVALIEAEDVPTVSLNNKITSAPTLVFFRDGKEIDRVLGFHPADMRPKIIELSSGVPFTTTSHKTDFVDPKQALNERLKKLINASRLMLFMKGTPDAPRCGFSRTIVGLLREVGAEFSSFDILSDEDVRQALKEYSNWPTYPQLYLDGKLLGGLDVVKEELQDKDFVDRLPKKN